jgi:GTPase SAR1 family protein
MNGERKQKILIKAPNIKLKTDVEKWNEKLHVDIPHLPFFIGIIGPRHRGKSVLLHNLLDSKHEQLYGQLFKKENIVLYSPTYDWDMTLHSLKLVHTYTNKDNVHELVASMKDQQEQHRKTNNVAPVLFVLEDITNIPDAFNVLMDLGYTGRHFNIHVLYVAHKLSSINRGVRTQTQQWILFEPHEQSEWQWILESFSRIKTQRIWENALRRAWSKPHNFVLIDYEEKEIIRIYRDGFHLPLFTNEELNALTSTEQDKKSFVKNPLKVSDDEIQ